MSRDQLLQQLGVEFQNFLSAIDGLSDEAMTNVWYDGWCVRDILAHVAGWHREMAGALERIGRGERPVPEGVDYSDFNAINARFVETQRSASPKTMIDELVASQRAFAEAASRLPEERFEEGRAAYRIINITGINHYREHAPPIQEWRKKEGL